MMSLILPLAPGCFVTGQISVEDVAVIAAEGFRTIVTNRPDGEGGAAQASSADLEAAARRHGLLYIYLPMERTHVDPRMADEFEEALVKAPAAVLGFCRTGARAGLLYNARKH